MIAPLFSILFIGKDLESTSISTKWIDMKINAMTPIEACKRRIWLHRSPNIFDQESRCGVPHKRTKWKRLKLAARNPADLVVEALKKTQNTFIPR
jgi:hypothetical protein